MNEACIDILCRLCLNKSYFYSHIYVGQSTNSGPIYETINYVYELQISVDDGLPEYVCQQCLSVVHEFDKYKRNAQKAKVELIRLKQNVQENPEILRGRNLSSKELVAEITPEVQENLQIFIKEEEDDECFDAENCVFTPAKEHNEGERKILIKEEEVDISDDSFETETTSVAQRSCTESQVPFGPMIHKNEIPPFRREDSYQEVQAAPLLLLVESLRNEVAPVTTVQDVEGERRGVGYLLGVQTPLVFGGSFSEAPTRLADVHGFSIAAGHLPADVVAKQYPFEGEGPLEWKRTRDKCLPAEEKKRGRCIVCPRKKDVKTKSFCECCHRWMCVNHMFKLCRMCVQIQRTHPP